MAPSAKRIIIAPLDWGLGHTTRCIPIIHALNALGQEVLFAGTEAQQRFIRRTFPAMALHTLGGYQVRYSKQALLLTILWQIPRLINIVKTEHAWLQGLVERERIDGIISDNRYGLWHVGKPSVILTHQLQVRSGLGKAVDTLLRKRHYWYLERFGEVWVPDLDGSINLAAELAHPRELPKGTRYVGWLSQFTGARSNREKGYVLVLLSGPEPQRSMLSDLLWQQAVALGCYVIFVEGKEDAHRTDVPPNISHHTLIDALALEPLSAGADVVVCRSGYSTLMDLAAFGKRAVLIPTPGQTEQEYLAERLASKGWCYIMQQKELNLEAAIRRAKELPGITAQDSKGLLLPTLERWLTLL